MTTKTDGPGIARVGTGHIAAANAKALQQSHSVYQARNSHRPVDPGTVTGSVSPEEGPE